MPFYHSVKSNIQTGDINVSVSDPTETAMNVSSGELEGGTDAVPVSFTIPAGAKKVSIENVGYVKPIDESEDITVNGTAWSVGRKEIFEEAQDRQNNRVKTLPSFEIISTGSRVRYSYES